MPRSHASAAVLLILSGLALAAALASLIFAAPGKADVTPLGRFRAYEVTCGATAARLSPPALQGAPSRFQSFELTNGSTVIYLGGDNVNDTGGVGKSMAADATKSIDGDPAALWCITASGTSIVSILAGQK